MQLSSFLPFFADFFAANFFAAQIWLEYTIAALAGMYFSLGLAISVGGKVLVALLIRALGDYPPTPSVTTETASMVQP